MWLIHSFFYAIEDLSEPGELSADSLWWGFAVAAFLTFDMYVQLVLDWVLKIILDVDSACMIILCTLRVVWSWWSMMKSFFEGWVLLWLLWFAVSFDSSHCASRWVWFSTTAFHSLDMVSVPDCLELLLRLTRLISRPEIARKVLYWHLFGVVKVLRWYALAQGRWFDWVVFGRQWDQFAPFGHLVWVLSLFEVRARDVPFVSLAFHVLYSNLVLDCWWFPAGLIIPWLTHLLHHQSSIRCRLQPVCVSGGFVD